MYKHLAVVAAILATGSVAASATTIDKSVTVKAPAEQVWKMIGPFCSIQDWHPAIGSCTEVGDTRTLKTKDGKATFEEKQTARSKAKMTYSYEILKSPLPVTGYKSTLKVTKVGANESKVEWSSTFTPAAGKEDAAKEALTGIYQAGLDNIEKTAGGK